MKVVCIDATYSDADIDESESMHFWSPEFLTERLKYRSSILTRGKVYDVKPALLSDKGVYFLLGDNGIQLYCKVDRFLTIEEYRQSQLNDILE